MFVCLLACFVSLSVCLFVCLFVGQVNRCADHTEAMLAGSVNYDLLQSFNMQSSMSGYGLNGASMPGGDGGRDSGAGSGVAAGQSSLG
jgi:hypothetical protein